MQDNRDSDWFIVSTHQKADLVKLITGYQTLRFIPIENGHAEFYNSLNTIEGLPAGSICCKIFPAEPPTTQGQLLVKVSFPPRGHDPSFYRAIQKGLGGFIQVSESLRYIHES